MPKGNPSKQTIASDKYQKKAGYITKGIKMKKDVADAFRDACERSGVSQASVISEFMKKYASEH